MRYIWSPWRMKYILHQEHVSSCIFCAALAKPDSVENLILSRGEHAFLILNRYPYTGGHVMVVPNAHVPSVEDLEADARAEIMEWVAHSITVLRDIFHPEAFNVGANIGAAAGAGVAEHVHFHVVPRWVGDTNFMSTVAGTRVLPEDLESVYQRMQAGWQHRFG
jgi:ATP adenylyltransferase